MLVFSFCIRGAEIGESFQYTMWSGPERGVGMDAVIMQVLELLFGFEVDVSNKATYLDVRTIPFHGLTHCCYEVFRPRPRWGSIFWQ